MKTVIFSIASLWLVLSSVEASSKNQSLKTVFRNRTTFAAATKGVKEIKKAGSAFFSNVHAEKEGRGIKIVWSLKTKSSNRYFVIERSSDGKNFESIGSYRESGSRRKNYSCEFIDEQPLTGTSYYRVKQINFNQGHQLSPCIFI